MRCSASRPPESPCWARESHDRAWISLSAFQRAAFSFGSSRHACSRALSPSRRRSSGAVRVRVEVARTGVADVLEDFTRKNADFGFAAPKQSWS